MKSQVCSGGATIVKNRSKIALYEVLLDLAADQEKDLGFDFTRLPNKQFLIDLIYIFSPRNPMFSFKAPQQENDHEIEFPVE